MARTLEQGLRVIRRAYGKQIMAAAGVPDEFLKSQVLYNLHHVAGSKHVWVVEGLLDAVHLQTNRFPAVALMGRYVDISSFTSSTGAGRPHPILCERDGALAISFKRRPLVARWRPTSRIAAVDLEGQWANRQQLHWQSIVHVDHRDASESFTVTYVSALEKWENKNESNRRSRNGRRGTRRKFW